MPQNLSANSRPTAQVDSGRRQRFLVVLFVDIVNSTKLLSQMLPEDAASFLQQAMDAMEEEVEQFGGRILKTQGDGFLAAFGLSRVTQTDVLQSCLAAEEVQKRISKVALAFRLKQPVMVRCGIHAGNVVLSEQVRNARSVFDAFGFAVNLAAKIEQSCPPGRVLISESTALLAETHIETSQFTELRVSEDADSIQVRLLEAVSESVSVSRLRILRKRPLIGRSVELRSVLDFFGATPEGCSQRLAIIGDAGVGKSRLASEVVSDHGTKGWQTLEARGLAYRSLKSFSALRDIISQLLALPAGSDLEDLKVAIDDVGLDQDIILAPVADLLQIETGDKAYFRTENISRILAIRNACRILMERFCSEQKWLLVLEDVHLMDADSFSLIQSIQSSLASDNWRTLMTLRPEGLERFDLSDSERVALSPLTAEAGLALIRSVNPDLKDPDPAALADIQSHTGGIPFALLSYAEALRTTAQNKLARASANVDASIQSRRDILTNEAVSILDVVALSNGGLETNYLREIFADNSVLDTGLRELIQARLIQIRAEDTVDVDHDLISRFSQNYLLRADRENIHRQILDALKASDQEKRNFIRLAYHAREAAYLDLALSYYWEASLEEVRRGSFDALEGIYQNVGEICDLSHPVFESKRAQFLILMFEAFHQKGRNAWLEERLIDVVKVFEAEDDKFLHAQALGQLSTLSWMRSDHVKALELADRAIHLSRDVGHAVQYLHLSYCKAAALHGSGMVDEAVSIYDELIAFLEKDPSGKLANASWRPLTIFKSMLTWCLCETGHFQRAQRLIADLDASTSLKDYPYSAILTLAAEGILWHSTANYERAIAAYEQSYQLCLTRDRSAMAPRAAAGLVQALVRQGLPERAREFLSNQYDGSLTAFGGRMNTVFLAIGRAEIACSFGEHADARLHAEEAVRLARENGEAAFLTNAMLTRADIALNSGEQQKAHLFYEAALTQAVETKLPPAIAFAKAGMALALRNTAPEKSSQWRRDASDELRAMGLQTRLAKLDACLDLNSDLSITNWHHDAI